MPTPITHPDVYNHKGLWHIEMVINSHLQQSIKEMFVLSSYCTTHEAAHVSLLPRALEILAVRKNASDVGANRKPYDGKNERDIVEVLV